MKNYFLFYLVLNPILLTIVVHRINLCALYTDRVLTCSFTLNRMYRLKPRRELGNLFSINNGCPLLEAGIGNISFVKDLMTKTVVTTSLKCSKFGQHVHPRLGWVIFLTLLIIFSYLTRSTETLAIASTFLNTLRNIPHNFFVLLYSLKGKMNYCLRHKCANGFAVIDALNFRYDNFGSYR